MTDLLDAMLEVREELRAEGKTIEAMSEHEYWMVKFGDGKYLGWYWEPVTNRLSARRFLNLAAARATVRGCGVIDPVECSIVHVRLRVRELGWGR